MLRSHAVISGVTRAVSAMRAICRGAGRRAVRRLRRPRAPRRARRPGGGIDGLAAAMVVAAAEATPLAGWAALPALEDPVAVLAGIGVGICSSVVPYVLDQLAMARLPRATYALLVAILPATATAVGIAVLGRLPAPPEAAGG